MRYGVTFVHKSAASYGWFTEKWLIYVITADVQTQVTADLYITKLICRTFGSVVDKTWLSYVSPSDLMTIGWLSL